MAPAFAALTVGVAVSLCLQVYGESLSNPGNVQFVADILHHVLHWEPGVEHTSETSYDVQYLVYGRQFPWTAIPGCTEISEHSCNLTNQTMNPSNRYYARVRAVSANRTSGWTRTRGAFSPQEATLRLADVRLLVEGNTIHVKLKQVHLSVGNKTVSFKDIQKYGRQYRTYVRRSTDTLQVQEETSEEFDIPGLLWGERYCVSVEPHILSRPVPSIRTEETCVTIPENDEHTGIISVSVGIFLLILLGTILLGTLLLCAYMKKPVRTPAILKSLLKPSGAEHEPFPLGASGTVLCLDEEPIQQLSVCQKDSAPPSSTESSSSSAPQPPAWGCVFLTFPDGPGHLPELEGLAGGDSSCNSLDSGISLQDSSSGLSQFSAAGSQDYKRQQPGGDDSGVSLAGTCSPSCRDYSAMEEGLGQPEGERAGSPPARGLSQEAAAFRGYLKQPKGTADGQGDGAGGVLPPQSPGGTDVSLETGCSEPALAKGYLKQALPGPPCGGADTPLTGESGLLGFPSSSLLHYGALGITGPSKPLPEAPSAWGLFSTDLLGSLPLISSLHSGERLHLEMEPLSLLGAGCKDSRL
ncbi:interleukin-10 receptor subunit alpha isoform X2 [Pelodiscus sinensis]|uniref:interleukin-10 receptor subunit alpha isoform X2 n=1 Tax=Pelodiscus sinensis TaxID=13735 RepID=UPI003F6C4FCA